MGRLTGTAIHCRKKRKKCKTDFVIYPETMKYEHNKWICLKIISAVK